MSALRHGKATGFFDGTSTYNASTNLGGGVNVPAGPSTFSAPQEIGRSADNFSFYVQVTSAPAFATQWVLQAAHSGSFSSEGVFADPDSTAYVWHDAWYLGTVGSGNSTFIRIDIPSGGGAVMSLVPDFTPGWVRLRRADTNGAVTVIAGWELQGD